MNINFETLKGGIEIMGFGMAGIFIVQIILYLVCLALLKFLPGKIDN